MADDEQAEKLQDLARQMRNGSGTPMQERLERLRELTREPEVRSRPTAEDREKILERLHRQHGDLPKRELLQRAMGEMITERMRINGVIRGGVVVPNTLIALPEGTEVEISFVLTELPPELQAEFEAWNRASDDAWALMAEWEQGAKL
jgi:hypothetical protein